jgi:hypothetical protein
MTNTSLTKSQLYASLQAERRALLDGPIAALKKQIDAIAKDAFREQCQDLFATQPALIAFSWTQYTPYFNDGENCEFGVNTDSPDIQVDGEEDLDEFYYSSYSKTPPTPRDLVGMEVVKFLQVYGEDDLLSMFGDHAKVTVTRSGVDVESYDHD